MRSTAFIVSLFVVSFMCVLCVDIVSNIPTVMERYSGATGMILRRYRNDSPVLPEWHFSHAGISAFV